MLDIAPSAYHHCSMSTNHEVVAAARAHKGKPFRHHFKPENLCDNGRKTVDSCMERGMDDDGFDCSGLVIASLCEVLKINAREWPRELRHVRQLTEYEERTRSKIGDIAIFYFTNSSRLHTGILTNDRTAIHASGISGEVEENKVLGEIARVGIIPAEKLLEIGFDTLRSR